MTLHCAKYLGCVAGIQGITMSQTVPDSGRATPQKSICRQGKAHYILPVCNGVAHTHPDNFEGGGGCHPPVCGVNTHGTLKPCALSTSCTRCHHSFLLKGGGRMAPTTPDSLAACICSAMLGTAAVSVGIAGIFGWLKHSGATVEPGSHLVEAMTSLAAVCAKTGLMW